MAAFVQRVFSLLLALHWTEASVNYRLGCSGLWVCVCVCDIVCVLVLGGCSGAAKSIIKLPVALYLLPFVTHTHTAGASHPLISRSSSSPLFPLSRSNSAYLERRLHGGDRGACTSQGDDTHAFSTASSEPWKYVPCVLTLKKTLLPVNRSQIQFYSSSKLRLRLLSLTFLYKDRAAQISCDWFSGFFCAQCPRLITTPFTDSNEEFSWISTANAAPHSCTGDT